MDISGVGDKYPISSTKEFIGFLYGKNQIKDSISQFIINLKTI
jgi:hypothetical protein